MESISWRKTLQISHNFMQWLVVNSLFQEKKQYYNRNNGSRETLNLGPYWELQPVTYMVNMEMKSEFRLSTETTLTSGCNKFLMRMSSKETEIPEDQLEKYTLKKSVKDLHADRRQKQNHQEENWLTLHQESFPLQEGIGSIDIHGQKFRNWRATAARTRLVGVCYKQI